MDPFESENEGQFRGIMTCPVPTRNKESLKQAILELHREEICDILFAEDTTLNYSVVIDIMALVDSASDSRIWSDLAVSPRTVLPILDSVLQDVQLDLIKMNNHTDPSDDYYTRQQPPMTLKTKCTARIKALPASVTRRTNVPKSIDVGSFLSITATVIRTGIIKMLENSKKFYCQTCKHTFKVLADVEQYNKIIPPTKCLAKTNTRPCIGTKFQMVEPPPGQPAEDCRDYQEIKIQEQTSRLTMGTIPGSILVILHDDLVDHAKSGDDVTVTGTVIRRWRTPIQGERCDIELALLANHVFIHNEQRVGVGVTDEQRVEFEQFWERARTTFPKKEFTARNTILSQICPRVYGLYIVKLAVMLVLTGGVQKIDGSGLRVRGEPHLLLVGDPGTGKSQFLKYAAELNPRSVLTTGIGSSSAGLTVTAVRDGNEWQLDAGALVLADRGLCCIDEFGGMREHDKTAIHEAMEQQSISIAKAGIVCKLNTRCSVIAATNPKGKYDPNQPVSINIALASPLLSRFDIVLVLMDTEHKGWDQKISSYILDTRVKDGGLWNKKKKNTSKKGTHQRQKGTDDSSRRRLMEERGEDPDEDVEPRVDGSNNIPDDEKDEEDAEEQPRPEEQWTLDKLKAYLIWIKSTFTPNLTPDAEEVLIKYYQLQRKADARNAARTTIRLLESLIRLSQAHARLMARNIVLVEDAVVVITVLEASVQGGTAILGGINPLHASFPKDSEQEYRNQEEIVLERLGLINLSTRNASRRDDRHSPSGDDTRFKRRREPSDEPDGPDISMVLDDQAEFELIARLRRIDQKNHHDGESVNSELEEAREESIINRRTTRQRLSGKSEMEGTPKVRINFARTRDRTTGGTNGTDISDQSEDRSSVEL